VIVDEPQGFRSSTPPVVAATSPFAVVRLHGHNAETYEKLNLSAAEWGLAGWWCHRID
jgi:hypothetical protein